MPRPKSDIRPVMFKLGQTDLESLEALAGEYDPPNRSEAVRKAIREARERLGRRQKKTPKHSG